MLMKPLVMDQRWMQEVPRERGQALAKDLGMEFFETSAKGNERVEEVCPPQGVVLQTSAVVVCSQSMCWLSCAGILCADETD